MHGVVIMPTRSLALKPMLTEMHKVQHVLLAVSILNPANNHFHPFSTMSMLMKSSSSFLKRLCGCTVFQGR